MSTFTNSPAEGSSSLVPDGKLSGLTRASLISRVRERDSQAWCELVDLYGPLIAHWCYRCDLDSHATADCVQEVFAAVNRALGAYQAQRESGAFRSWLWTITKNKVRDHLRRNRHHDAPRGGSSALERLRQVPSADSVPDDEPSSVSEIQSLVARGLEQVRGEFEPRTWEIFTRAVIDCVPTAVVMAEFDIQSATVRQVRSRVLRRLRQQLGDIGY